MELQPSAANNAVGKTCPYCQTPIKPGVAVHACEHCGIAHHDECWQANGGCTTFGCVGAAQRPAPSAPSAASPPPPVAVQQRRLNQAPSLVAAVAILSALMIGFLASRPHSAAPAAPEPVSAPSAWEQPAEPVEPAQPAAPPERTTAESVADVRADSDRLMQAFDNVQVSVDTGGDLGDFLTRYSAARATLHDYLTRYPNQQGQPFVCAIRSANRAYAEYLGAWQQRLEAESRNNFAAARTLAQRMAGTRRVAEGLLDDARAALENQ